MDSHTLNQKSPTRPMSKQEASEIIYDFTTLGLDENLDARNILGEALKKFIGPQGFKDKFGISIEELVAPEAEKLRRDFYNNIETMKLLRSLQCGVPLRNPTVINPPAS